MYVVCEKCYMYRWSCFSRLALGPGASRGPIVQFWEWTDAWYTWVNTSVYYCGSRSDSEQGIKIRLWSRNDVRFHFSNTVLRQVPRMAMLVQEYVLCRHVRTLSCNLQFISFSLLLSFQLVVIALDYRLPCLLSASTHLIVYSEEVLFFRVSSRELHPFVICVLFDFVRPMKQCN